MDGPMSEKDGWNEWWDGPRPSERPARPVRPIRPEPSSQTNERSMRSFWDEGDLLSDPILEEGPRRAARDEEAEIEASISPVEKPRARRARPAAKPKRR